MTLFTDKMRQASNDPDSSHAADADVDFHAALLRATHNELLAGLRIVIEHGLRQRDLTVHSQPHATDPVPSHQAVLDAVRSGNSDAAAAAMLDLLNLAATDFEALRTARSTRRRNTARKRS